MNIRTSQDSTDTFFYIDCENSTAVNKVAIVVNSDDCRPFVQVTWANGERWGYRLPSPISLVAMLGEKSVGRFANAVKREATFACKH
jgi:hypothetical protein